MTASVQLQVACNGEDLGDETPTLESWAPQPPRSFYFLFFFTALFCVAWKKHSY